MLAGARRVAGRHMESFHGLFLGGTFFAVYRNQPLTRFRQSADIAFFRYRWDDIPPHHQAILEKLKLRANLYDTAKVLNILMQHQGHKLGYEPLVDLVHLGGLYRPERPMQVSIARRSRNRVLRALPPSVLHACHTLPISQHLAALAGQLADGQAWRERTLVSRRFFEELLSQGTLPNLDAPHLRKISPEMRNRLRTCGEQVLAIYCQYGLP